MDILSVSLCLFALVVCPSFGQDAELVVKFKNETRVDVSEGAEKISLTCSLNRGPMYVINNKVEMIHVDPMHNTETIISSAADLVEGKPEFYEVKVVQDPDNSNKMLVEFTIITVRYEDDGMYKCKVSPGVKSTLTETAEATREIVVHRPLESLKLKFGDFEAITDTPSDPIKIDHGRYKVACIASGSNPATKDISLDFDGKSLGKADVTVTPMEGAFRKFSSEISDSVNIMVSNSGQEFECSARDSSGSYKTVKLGIDVNTYDPIVFCNDTEAFHGQDNPILSCTVNYTGMEVTSFAFQIGDTGEIIKEGDSHDKNIVVTVSNVADGVSVVSLDLHKAEHEYLDKNYYILIDLKGGHSTKESVRLHKIEGGNGNGGNGVGKMYPVVWLYVIVCVVMAWTL